MISGSTELAFESSPNRSPVRSADVFQYFFGQMDTECDVDHIQTILNIVHFWIHRIGGRIGTEPMARIICWRFPNFFRSVGHRMRRWLRTNSFEHCTTSGPPNRQWNRGRIDHQSDLLTILKFFRPDGHRMRCWLLTNSFEHCTISGSTESASNRYQIDGQSNIRQGV